MGNEEDLEKSQNNQFLGRDFYLQLPRYEAAVLRTFPRFSGIIYETMFIDMHYSVYYSSANKMNISILKSLYAQ
jgi:hypothetical protein